MRRRVRKSPSNSREFEALAARLEAALAPTGARVKSPDRLRDKFTGQYREVDASIRYSVGSSDLLITIECRDRVRTQDVTWIEQLATKRAHVGADRTLAVSSSPFTEAALRAARAHGISTRLISEVTDQELRSLTNVLEVSVESVDLSLQKMQLRYVETMPASPALDPEAMQAWSADCWNAPIFRVENADHPASLNDLIKLATKPAVTAPTEAADPVTLPPQSGMAIATDSLSAHLKDVPAGGPPVTKHFLMTFEADRVFALTDMGLKQLQAVSIEVTAVRSIQTVPPTRVATYATEDQLITRFAEHKVEWKPGETWSVLSYPTPTDTRLVKGGK